MDFYCKKVLNNGIVTKAKLAKTEKTLKDDDGNLIKVQKGFKIAKDSEINVTEGNITKILHFYEKSNNYCKKTSIMI